ncbi:MULTISPECIES: superoxide dismutase [Myroides]|uniref:superoxide dismutase n=1 Tax=Myroides TaxID=76831 RepID=UPI000353FC85|nr:MULTISPECIES: superoxide dismutase [Myroides]AJA67874.1 Superoxide dismutase [Myroides sp. A21]EPH08320.1 Fe-Mn family superoxide dismutase [Myroides odoratimimus CCUG 12700]MDM1518518.1 superoxide dismutase [Myroides odoratimimus]
MKFKLPDLPYDKNSFNSFISTEGFDYHYGKHHQTYVNNLNHLITNTKWEDECLENIITGTQAEGEVAIFNNAAQHFNHSFFWKSITPNQGGQPSEELLDMIGKYFGSLEELKTQFIDKATKLFGSGWVWLVLTPENKLELMSLKDADTPIVYGNKPLLTIDVWEHAYYIDHRNARPSFIQLFWNAINWEFVNKNLVK